MSRHQALPPLYEEDTVPYYRPRDPQACDKCCPLLGSARAGGTGRQSLSLPSQELTGCQRLRDSGAGTKHCPYCLYCPMGPAAATTVGTHKQALTTAPAIPGVCRGHNIHTPCIQGVTGSTHEERGSKHPSPHVRNKDPARPINKHFFKSFTDKQVQFSCSAISSSL